MKTSILLFVFVSAFVVTISGAPINEQTSPYSYKHPLLELYNKFNAGYSYNTNNRHKQASQYVLDSVEHQSWDGDEFNSYYKVDHIYQSGVRVETRHSHRSFVEANWQITSRETYEYENDRLISIVNQASTGQSFINDYRTLFTYQLNGSKYLLFEMIEQYWNPDETKWENDERTALILSNGKISLGESSSWLDDDWQTYELFFFEEQGDDLYVTYQESYGPFNQNWRYTERQIFENFSIDEMYHLFTVEMNIIETGSLLELAELLPDYTEQARDGNDWLDVSRQVTDTWYDIWDGQIVQKIISTQAYDDEWIPFFEVSISYEEGLAKEIVLFVPSDDESFELIATYAEELLYNDQELVQYVIQKGNFDGFDEVFKVSETDDLNWNGRLMLQWSGITTSVGNDVTPLVFSLDHAYPNPFNPSTVIPFQVGVPGHISIRVFDMLGRNVALLVNDVYPAGKHTVRFDAPGFASGVYLVRLDAPGYQQTRRVTLLK